MNKISTLFAFACSFVFGSAAWAQTSEGFNTSDEVATLRSNCWQFNGFSYSTNDLGGGTGSVVAPLSDLPTIHTPLLSKPAGDLTVTLTYRVITTKPGINSIKADVWGNGIAYTDIVGKKNVNTGDLNSITFTLDAKNVPSLFSVVISGSNMSVEIDNVIINAAPAPGGCVAPITLPVKLMNFQGSVAGNKAQLKWSVADNETGNYFQVLRSVDGKTFAESATLFVNSKVGAESYTFADSRELEAVTYYKLKIVNKDGSVSYSGIIALKSATAQSGSALVILQNPVESTLNFNYTSATSAQSHINIYSTTGVKVYSSRLTSQKGTNTVSLNLDSHLAAGTYLLEVVNGIDRSVTRLVKK